jgi:murein DD-endopeptidase MepM/ murein hydrolase activator NlpD
MRRHLALLVSLAGLVLAALGPGTAAAKDRYANPFADPAWEAGRTDMGMDWAPLHRLPVVAIGDGVILGSSDHSGWPGKHFIYYQLSGGSHAGNIIYVAEHLARLARAGTHVHAGQRIALALPGYPYIETGWADQYGSPRAYPCYHEGQKTNSGKEMERFLMSLGASQGDPAGKGPSRPSGKLC